MEKNDLEQSISLLLHLLPRPQKTLPNAQFEATLRMLLTQALHKSNAHQRAHAQARLALAAAERTNNRELIWKSMALLTSIEIIDNGDL